MGKWDSLSMRERRDMIRLHLQNGVTDLKDIRSSYNEFSGGGDVSAIPYKSKLKMGEPVDKSKYDDDQTYLNDWLRARKSTGNYNDQLGGMEYNRQITNLSTAKKVEEFDFYKNLFRLNGMPSDEIPNHAVNEMIYNRQNDINGAYLKANHELWARGSGEHTHSLHERTHSLNATPQENLIKTQIPLNDQYWDDPSEIYSRLMEFRRKNNIDPKKNYSLSEIEDFKSKANKDQLFDRYTVKQLHFLLNRVAQNDQSSQLPDNFNIGIQNIT